MHTSSSFSDDDDPYFQIDLGYVDEIRGLATQGHEAKYWFVRTFTLSFSLDGITWFNYTENGLGTKVVCDLNDSAIPTCVLNTSLQRPLWE